MKTPKVRKTLIKKFINGMRLEEKWAEEYVTSEDSALAEYVGSLGYGEGEVRTDKLDDDVAEAVKHFLTFRKTSDLVEFCSVELGDIYYQDNEIYSATIGEQEHQLGDEMQVLFDKLNEAEREIVEKETYVRRGGWFYTSHEYERFVLVLDPDKFMKAYKKLGKKAPKAAAKSEPKQYGKLTLVWSRAD